MDYGQPLSNCCGGNCSTETQTSRPVQDIVPEWMRAMLDAIPETGSELKPVTSIKRTAAFKTKEFEELLVSSGWPAAKMLKAYEQGGNAAEHLKASIGEELFADFAANVVFGESLATPEPVVTEEALLKKGTESMRQNPAIQALVNLIQQGSGSLGLLPDLRALGLTGPVGKPGYHVSEHTKVVGDLSTLAEVVTAHIIPDFLQKLLAAVDIKDPAEQLRAQHKAISRLHKLMQYTRKPGLITPTSIACKHEFAIYQWQQYNSVIRQEQSEQDCMENIFAAGSRLKELEEKDRDNTKAQLQQQELNQRRAAVMDQITSQVGEVEALINGLETTQLAKKLRDMAEELDRVENGGAIKQQAELPFVPGAKPAQDFGVHQSSDHSDMGLDYRRQVPTTEGGFSDDKFGAATRNSLVNGQPFRGDLQMSLSRPSVFSPEEQLRTIAAGQQARLDRSGPGVQSSVYPPHGTTLVSPTSVGRMEQQRRVEFVRSITERLNNGEALAEAELLKAGEIARVTDIRLMQELAKAVGERMMGSTPFLQ